MNIHYVEIFPRPHWRRFLRRDQFGRIADNFEARAANTRHAIRNDRRLKHLARAGDVAGCCRRLAKLGIESHAALVAAIIEGRL